MNNNTEQISRYLQNEMSGEERIAFEKQLSTDKDLQQELAIQQQVIRAAETAGLKTEFGKAIRKKVFNQRLLQWGIPALIITAAFVIYAVTINLFSSHTDNEKPKTESAERFVINNNEDTIIETKDGVVFGIPANAFGNAQNVELEIKTALTPYDIMRQGLSTVSNGSLLQTGGMFYIKGYENGQPLELKKNIDVSVPAAEINPEIQLFRGEKDSAGNINWVNPKPVAKQLRTYDITTLDFYPPDYIPTLKALGKEYANKKYTDSLYYSFSGNTRQSDKTVASLKTVDTAKKDSVRSTERIGSYFETKIRDTSFKLISDDIYPFGDSVYIFPLNEIDPSKIKAIWDNKFNNTILATKEFEERLRYMHSLCTAEYFKLYVTNLNKTMFEIDQVCANRTSGDVRKKFLEFAARKDGSVIINEGMQAKLSEYFQIKYKAYQQAAAETWAKYQDELARLNAIADKKRGDQDIRDIERNSSNYQEEFSANLLEAYRQLGVKYYNVTIPAAGWYNLDVFVKQVTSSRQTGTYTDSLNGKTVTLTYNNVSIGIENLSAYDKVFVYLLPDGLSSFQRIKQKGDLFKDGLNSLFKYDAVTIGYKGTETFFYKQTGLQGGQYTFNLSSVTDAALKEALKSYSIQKNVDLQTEIDYRLFEQQEINRQVQVRKDWELREQVAAAIFKCGEGTSK